MPRKYELKERAERQAETRRRIVDAVVALHRQIGPARTTISAIAERAGVERLTVYRHFADESSLFAACSAHFATEVPPPDPALWSAIRQPRERLRAALLAFYAYYAPERTCSATSCTMRRRARARRDACAPACPRRGRRRTVAPRLDGARPPACSPERRRRSRHALRHLAVADARKRIDDAEVADLMTELALSVMRRKG